MPLAITPTSGSSASTWATEPRALAIDASVLGGTGVTVSAYAPGGTLDVDSMGDGFEVFGIDAGWVPTQMVYIESIGDRSLEQPMSRAMSRLNPPHTVGPSEGEQAVACWQARPKPFPTPLTLGYESLEAGHFGCDGACHITDYTGG